MAGWKLLPVKATPEMLRACMVTGGEPYNGPSEKYLAECYETMIAACPPVTNWSMACIGCCTEPWMPYTFWRVKVGEHEFQAMSEADARKVIALLGGSIVTAAPTMDRG